MVVGPDRFENLIFVFLDDTIGSFYDCFGAAVILLEPDDLEVSLDLLPRTERIAIELLQRAGLMREAGLEPATAVIVPGPLETRLWPALRTASLPVLQADPVDTQA